ncbi:MAG TPA: extracellular solute-binding protein [Nocardioides sp.]|nr:extracellular solute-binding protein [Nocardioides sp.]
MNHPISRDRRRTRRLGRLSVAFVAVGAIAVLSACGSSNGSSPSAGGAAPPMMPTSLSAANASWAQVVSRAKAEKTLVFYGLGSDLSDPLVKGFQKAYPWAQVKVVNGSPGDNLSRLETEAKTGAPTADVFLLPQSLRKSLLDNKIVQQTTVPSDFTMTASFQDSSHYAHPVYVSPIVLDYNTNKISASQMPKTLYDLADPKYKGMITFDSPQNVALAAHLLVAPEQAWGMTKWEKWLDGLKANDVLISADATSAYQAALQGNAAIAVDTPSDVLNQKSGTPMAYALYKDAVPFAQFAWLDARAPHVDMGRLFLDWMMSKQGQAVYAATGRSPALSSVKSSMSLSKLVPAQYGIAPVSVFKDFYANPQPFIDQMTQRWPQ